MRLTLARCGPADTYMYRRSIGSTRFCVSSKRHPISPLGLSGEAPRPRLLFHTLRHLVR
jgi:hypothetical protein